MFDLAKNPWFREFQKCIQNPVKHLRLVFLQKQLKIFLAKSPSLDARQVS